MTHPATRIREIDLLRSFAIFLMTVFHAVFDLAVFYEYDFEYDSGFWYYIGKTSAILFILVSGVSTTLGRHSLRRGFVVLSAGFVVTAVTYWLSPADFIVFGILQLLGTSMLTYPWLKKLPPGYLLLLACLIFPAGYWAANHQTAFPQLIPFGFTPPSFSSLDYYPLLPWYSVYLLGVWTGKCFYSDRQPLCKLPENRISFFLETIGRHSLLFYLLHQPILLALLYLLHGKPG
ncbi:putative membrane protein [Propionispora sp. 2/2-37]|uniref:heparan-alpha-glucosaminide N-acetyltransferase n=1 Tax=Propionispora sp. 2/2-37 TaxID=1677858 RepID=UPI0006BB5502|nr:heparan-alpha-glucosaminide N-acetyltransferase [Propionispora sp. 2/2-37]CUH95710.1 putative membrane protein [Propionispora sp. 2/2-37]